MKKTLLWLIVIVVLQIGWTTYTATTKELELTRGTTVLLETAPVDPRDLLSGDYVILGYKISTVPLNLFQEYNHSHQQIDKLPNRTVYVALRKTGEFYEAAHASLTDLSPQPGEVIIKGRITPNQWQPNAVGIEYGIEKYFVREGTGSPSGKLTVKAVISKDGDALIKQVYINGKPYTDVMRPQSRK